MIIHGNGFRIQKGYRMAAFPGRRTHVVKSTKHWETTIRLLISRGKGPLTLDLIRVSAIACAIPTPSSGEVPLPTSSINTKDLGVTRPTGERRGTIKAQCLSTYQVSLHNLPSHWQTCSNSSPCRRRLKVVRVGNRVLCTNISLCNRHTG